MSLNCGSLDPAQSLTLKKLTMQGDILLGANSLKTTDLLLKQLDVSSMTIKDVTDTSYRDILTRTGNFDIMRAKGVTVTIYGVRTFTTAPALADMEVGEIALGNGTGGTGENEWFIKVSATHIARFVRDSDITT